MPAHPRAAKTGRLRSRPVFLLLAGAIAVGCQPRPMLPPPIRIESLCRNGQKPDVQRMREVAAAIEDGQRFKGSSAGAGASVRFPRDIQDDTMYGAVVGFWRPNDLRLPMYRAYMQKYQSHGRRPVTGLSGAIAIDDGPSGMVGRRRFVYVGLSVRNRSEPVWYLSDSFDADPVCR